MFKINPSDMPEVLDVSAKTGLSVLIEGSPGIGKTQSVEAYAASRGIGYCDFRATLHDPCDINFPIVDVGARAVHWVGSVIPEDPAWEGVICIDEIGQASQAMQACLLQILQERRIGNRQLPKKAVIVGLTNSQEDGAGVQRLITPLTNRVIFYQMEISHEAWLRWATETGRVNPMVRAFIAQFPARLFEFKAGRKINATPRTWEAVSRVQACCPKRLESASVEGCVGDTAATYLAYCSFFDKIPTKEEVFARPKEAIVPTDPSCAYAACSSLGDWSRGLGVNSPELSAICTYAVRMRNEMLFFAINQICMANQKAIFSPVLTKIFAEHKDAFALVLEGK